MDVHGVVHRHRVHKLPVLDVAQSDARVDAGRIEGTPVDPESHAAAHHAWPHGLSKHEAPHPRWRWKGFDGYQFLRQRDNAIGLSGIGESCDLEEALLGDRPSRPSLPSCPYPYPYPYPYRWRRDCMAD